MDDLRYLLRVLRRVGRVIRRRVQQAWQARRALKFLLLVVVGVLFWAAVRRYISSELVDAAFWVAVAVLGIWAGVRVGSVVKRVYLYQRRLRSRDSERFFAFSYEATLEPHSEQLHQLALQTLREAETYLQTTLPSRLGLVDIVTEPLARIWRDKSTGYTGWARQETESITIVYREDMDALRRTFLHEWAHIVTACWNEDVPALFLEGIAEATEYHGSPTTVHSYALYFLHYFPTYSLLFLLDEARFRDQELERAHYAWAGSFTLYLIEQFGLVRFREFYTQLRRSEEDCAFQQVFGMSLGQAEMLWREYLHTQLPESARTETLQEVLEHRLRWAIMDGEGVAIVQALSEQMVQMRPDLWLGYYGRAYCAFWTGDLQGARQAFEQANAAPVQSDDALRGRAWFECGLLCDLLQMRERAVACYQTALQYPDCEDARAAHHAHANRYLATPYDYAERYRFLRLEQLRERLRQQGTPE
jgi:tetratricopeptide (TPR) repeat protein